ncbi:MAG: polymer-forming cytoskeletal protein, partial [Nisaea sp.]
RQLEVTESGHFKGKVVIDEAIIGGRFEGTLVVRDVLQIRSTGRVTGSVRFGQLEVELGGQIDGDISIFKDEPVKTPE